jgi:hypothetical protein
MPFMQEGCDRRLREVLQAGEQLRARIGLREFAFAQPIAEMAAPCHSPVTSPSGISKNGHSSLK